MESGDAVRAQAMPKRAKQHHHRQAHLIADLDGHAARDQCVNHVRMPQLRRLVEQLHRQRLGGPVLGEGRAAVGCQFASRVAPGDGNPPRVRVVLLHTDCAGRHTGLCVQAAGAEQGGDYGGMAGDDGPVQRCQPVLREMTRRNESELLAHTQAGQTQGGLLLLRTLADAAPGRAPAASRAATTATAPTLQAACSAVSPL